MGKNVILFRAHGSPSVHIDNGNKDILIVGGGPTQKLVDNTLIAETKFINFIRPNKRFVLSLHYNGSNSFSFVSATKIHQVKAKYSEIKDCTLFLGNISKDFTVNNMRKKTNKEQKKKNRIKRNCNIFSC